MKICVLFQMNNSSFKSISTQAVWVCMILAVIFQGITSSPANRSPAFLPHHFTKRSFFDIQCKGVYDKSIFAKLDSICEDCYNLFREPQLHNLCRYFTKRYTWIIFHSSLSLFPLRRFGKLIIISYMNIDSVQI